MGSEMCIRDSNGLVPLAVFAAGRLATGRRSVGLLTAFLVALPFFCLLYTSDAADERSSVDLGGRRIIKKKKYLVVVSECLS